MVMQSKSGLQEAEIAEDFKIVRSKEQFDIVWPSAYVLRKCYIILTNKIAKEKNNTLKARLKEIRKEISSIAENL
jgi:hypothetical protein